MPIKLHSNKKYKDYNVTAKIIFALFHYGVLALFVASAYGLGRPLVDKSHSLGISPLLTTLLRLIAGIGVFMVILFIIGILGFLQPFIVLFLLIVGWSFAITPLLKIRSRLLRFEFVSQKINEIIRGIQKNWHWILLAIAAILTIALRPLQPPMAWDEISYHLPYAQFWADQGRLAVDPWLRYPLSVFNLSLLYSAALPIVGDVFPHLLHAGMAALTAMLTFAIAQRYLDWRIGLIAAIALLHATRWLFSTAYVDLGVMLFWTSAFSALALRYETGLQRFSYLAAFFAGIAIGIKYQALFYLPVFGIVALLVERHPLTIARSALIIIFVGGYWYLRNTLISGDPLHPIGGGVFGFWLWNSEDLTSQYTDLDRVKAWPEWYLMLGFGTIFFLRNSSFFLRGIFLASSVGFVIWFLVSGYPRYLIPIYPMLTLLSACVALAIWLRMQPRLAGIWIKIHPKIRFLSATAILLFAFSVLFEDIAKFWSRIHPEPQGRAEYLSKRMPGYNLLRSIETDPDLILYQFGFEDEIYYLKKFTKHSIRGDHFGVGRYKDVIQRASNASALAQHLRSLGVNALLINKSREPLASTQWDPAFGNYFELIARSNNAAIYRLINNSK